MSSFPPYLCVLLLLIAPLSSHPVSEQLSNQLLKAPPGSILRISESVFSSLQGDQDTITRAVETEVPSREEERSQKPGDDSETVRHLLEKQKHSPANDTRHTTNNPINNLKDFTTWRANQDVNRDIGRDNNCLLYTSPSPRDS